MAATPNVFEKMRDTLLVPYFNTIIEIQRLFPDSILFGSIILYITTMNSVFGYFAVFLLEVFASHKLLSSLITKVTGPLRSESSSGSTTACYPGFRGARKEVERISRFNEYPSISVTALSAVAMYILSSMIKFSDTLTAMGDEWGTRFGFSVAFIVIICLSTFFYRWFMMCEGFGEIAVGVIFGIALGISFFFANTALFGNESVNFLGLPYLVNKSEQGSDMYICVPSMKP
jgi:hypothetical protein